MFAPILSLFLTVFALLGGIISVLLACGLCQHVCPTDVKS